MKKTERTAETIFKLINFIEQNKGGAGKTTLATLLALMYDSKGTFAPKKEQEAEEGLSPVMFVDADNHNYSLSKKQAFLLGKNPSVLRVENLLDTGKRMVRDRFMTSLRDWSELPYEKFYVDLGAGESEELINLLELKYNIDQLKKYADSLGVKIVHNVVISGGSNFTINFDYMKKIVVLNKGVFDLIVWVNEYTFYQQQLLVEEINKYAVTANKLIPNSVTSVNKFGGFDNHSEITNEIIANLGAGKGYAEYEMIQQWELDNQFENFK